jgi:hypothetical protein
MRTGKGNANRHLRYRLHLHLSLFSLLLIALPMGGCVTPHRHSDTPPDLSITPNTQDYTPQTPAYPSHSSTSPSPLSCVPIRVSRVGALGLNGRGGSEAGWCRAQGGGRESADEREMLLKRHDSRMIQDGTLQRPIQVHVEHSSWSWCKGRIRHTSQGIVDTHL